MSGRDFFFLEVYLFATKDQIVHCIVKQLPCWRAWKGLVAPPRSSCHRTGGGRARERPGGDRQGGERRSSRTLPCCAGQRARKQTGLAVSTASRMEGDFETPVTKDGVKAVEYLALRGEDFGEMTTTRTVIPWVLKAML